MADSTTESDADSQTGSNSSNTGSNGILIETLKKRSDFLAARKGVRLGGHFFALQSIKSPCLSSPCLSSPCLLADHPSRDQTQQDETKAGEPAIARFGYTVTKRVGNAVERNRIRRRLRAAVAMVAPEKAEAGKDFVLLARRESLEANFASLVSELTRLLDRSRGKTNTRKSKPPKPAITGKNRTS